VKAQKDEATGAFTIEPKNERVELGYKFEACPVVAADRRSVLLDLRCRMAALGPALASGEGKTIPPASAENPRRRRSGNGVGGGNPENILEP
jgi:hypothetical protein